MIRMRRAGRAPGPLRALLTIGATGHLADGRLLDVFVEGEDQAAEAAFATLVERHGSLVWGTCLALLRDEHDAEDAFQAVFLVLAAKAGSLRVMGSLGPWLHQVARRTAAGLRRADARRRGLERRLEHVPPMAASVASPDFDRAAAIHEEVAGLPEHYRAALTLCDLQGRTHREAARSLGWPVGTVKSRQSRGRDLLRERLARRGVGIAVAGLIVSPPRALAGQAVRLALDVSTRDDAVSSVLYLTRGVLRAMFWTQLRPIATFAAAAAISLGGAGVYVHGFHPPAAGDGPPPAAGPARVAPPPKDEGKVPSPERLRAELVAQRLAVRRALALYKLAEQERAVAEVDAEEYEVVAYPRDRAKAEAYFKSSESDHVDAKDRADWAARMREKGYLPASRADAEAKRLVEARSALVTAADERLRLERTTRPETVSRLRRVVDKAEAAAKARRETYERERAWEAELERRVAASDDRTGR